MPKSFTKCNTFLSVLQGVQVILEHPSGAPKFLLLRRRSFGLNKPQKKLPHFLWYFSVNALLTCQTKMQAAFLNPSFGTAGSLLVAYLLMKPLGVSLKHWHFFKRVNASNLTQIVANCLFRALNAKSIFRLDVWHVWFSFHIFKSLYFWPSIWLTTLKAQEHVDFHATFVNKYEN